MRYWSATLAVIVLLAPVPAFAEWVSFPTPVHQTLVLLHVFGAIIFMGNIIVSAMWMANAKRTRDTAVLHFASRMVVRADAIFTIPGIVLILVPGLMIVGPWGGFPAATWAELALALFIVSGVIWGAVLLPLQKRMLQMTREAVELRVGLSDRYYGTLARWNAWGGVATLLPLFALYLMVFKPHLWG
jgi:uncharacterized membrane protein